MISSPKVNQPILLLWKVDGTWLGNQQQRANVGGWWLEGTPQPTKSLFNSFKVALESFEMKMRTAWRCKYLKLWKKERGWRFNEHGLVGSLWKLIGFKVC